MADTDCDYSELSDEEIEQLSLRPSVATGIIIKLLRSIAGGGGGSASLESTTWIDQETVDTEVSDLTAYVPLAVDLEDILYMTIKNSSDEAILISFDGGTTDHEVLGGNGSSVTYDFAQDGTKFSGDVSVKAASGTSIPSTGLIYLSGYTGA